MQMQEMWNVNTSQIKSLASILNASVIFYIFTHQVILIGKIFPIIRNE